MGVTYINKKEGLQVLLLFLAIVIFLSPVVNNDTVFAGDGKRIYTSIEFTDYSEEIYPLWNPTKILGMPSFADPERFFWLGYLVDLNESNVHLKINLIMLLLILILSASVVYFFRGMGFSFGLCCLAAFVFVISGDIGRNLYVGRVYSIINVTFSLFAAGLVLHAGGRLQPAKKLILALLIGISFSIIGYYALLMPAGFVFVLYFWAQKNQKTVLENFKHTTVSMAGIGIAGLLMMAVFLLPLVFYNANVVTHVAAQGLSHGLARPETFINLFYPFFILETDVIRNAVFPHISLIILPGLLLFFGANNKNRNPYWQVLTLLACVSLIISLGKLPFLDWLVQLYEKTPVLSHLRHGNPWQRLFSISVLGLVLTGFSSQNFDYKKLVAGCIVLAIFLIITLTSTQEGVSFYKSNFLTILMFTGLTVLFVLIYPMLSRFRFTGIVAISGILIIQIFGYDHLINDKSAIQSSKIKNQHRHSRDIEHMTRLDTDIFNEDHDIYRILCRTSFDCPPVGAGKVSGVQGFSYYFSPEARNIYESIGRKSRLTARPHWVKMKRCAEQSPVWMDVLNIKYLLCRNNSFPETSTSYTLLEKHKKRSIYIRQDWKSAFRLFYQWNLAEGFNGEETISAWKKGVVLTNSIPKSFEESGQSPKVVIPEEFSSDSISFATDTEFDAILYLPELYDSGWKVYINDQSAEVLRLYGSFRGVGVPKGKNRIRFEYQPDVVTISFLITIASLAIFIGLAYFQRKTIRLQES